MISMVRIPVTVVAGGRNIKVPKGAKFVTVKQGPAVADHEATSQVDFWFIAETAGELEDRAVLIIAAGDRVDFPYHNELRFCATVSGVGHEELYIFLAACALVTPVVI